MQPEPRGISIESETPRGLIGYEQPDGSQAQKRDVVATRKRTMSNECIPIWIEVNGNGAATAVPEVDFALLDRAGVAMKVDSDQDTHVNRDSQFARFQSDAPGCDNCGSITVRNGNCYLCHNCGNSMGCS